MDWLALSRWFFWWSCQGSLMKLQADSRWDCNHLKAPLGFLDSLASPRLHVASGLLLVASPTGYLDLLYGISVLPRVRVPRNKGRSWNITYELAQKSCRITSITFDWSKASQAQLIFKSKWNRLCVLREKKQDHITKEHVVGGIVVATFGNTIC